MQERATILVSNGEDDEWMRGLLLSYVKLRSLTLWERHTEAVVLETEVEYCGHKWRAVPYSSPTTNPRLELCSQTTSTVVAVPVENFVMLLARLNNRWEGSLQHLRSALVCMANRSVRDF